MGKLLPSPGWSGAPVRWNGAPGMPWDKYSPRVAHKNGIFQAALLG